MITLVAKAGCVAVVGGVCALALRRYVPELSLVLALVTAGAVLALMLGAVTQVQEAVEMLMGYAGLEEELTGPVVKVTLIAILSRLMSQICKDAGEGTIALCCEVAGTFGALAVTVPLMRRVLELIGGFLV